MRPQCERTFDLIDEALRGLIEEPVRIENLRVCLVQIRAQGRAARSAVDDELEELRYELIEANERD